MPTAKTTLIAMIPSVSFVGNFVLESTLLLWAHGGYQAQQLFAGPEPVEETYEAAVTREASEFVRVVAEPPGALGVVK